MRIIEGDITSTDCKFICHGCNAQGKMGSGVAKALRNRWPEIYPPYKKYCDMWAAEGGPPVGFLNVVETSDGKVIGNCITQQFYGFDGKRYANPIGILNSLMEFMRTCYDRGHEPKLIAVPRIGCHLGGLTWDEVEPIFHTVEAYWDVEFIVYVM